MQLPAQLLGDNRPNIVALGGGGEILISLLSSKPARRLEQGRLAIAANARAANDSFLVPLGPPREEPQQISGGALTPNHVVWMETPSTSLDEDPWVLYRFDRRTQTTSEIARAPRLGDGSTPGRAPGYTSVVAFGDRMAWAQVTGRNKSRARVDVLMCRIDRCVPRVAVKNAAYPQLTRRGLYAVQRERSESGEASTKVVLRRSSGPLRTVYDLSGPQKEVIGFAATDSNWIATQLGNENGSAGPTALISHAGETVRIDGQPGQNFAYPVSGSGLVAWAEASGAATQLGGYVYSLSEQQVLTAGNRKGLYGLKAAGRYLAWQVDRTRGRADLDGNRWVVAKLPASPD